MKVDQLPPNIQALFQNPEILTDGKTIFEIQTQLSGETVEVFHGIMDQFRLILTNAICYIFIIGVVMAIIAAIVVIFLLKEVPLQGKSMDLEDMRIEPNEI